MYSNPSVIFPLHLYSWPPCFLHNALDFRTVLEKTIAGLLLDLGHGGLVFLPPLTNVIMIRHNHGEDLRFLLALRKTLAAFERDNDLPCVLGNINPLEYAL